jgi:putative tricarboxylic transport membrane protein
VQRGWITASGIFLVLFGGAVYLSARLPLLDALGPGPGFFPLILGVLGAVLSLVLIAQLVRQPDGSAEAPVEDEEPFVPEGTALVRIVGIVVLLGAAFFALDGLGYRITALLFISLLLFVLGVRNYLAIALVAIVLSFGVFHSFYYWLKVPLPIGSLGL